MVRTVRPAVLAPFPTQRRRRNRPIAIKPEHRIERSGRQFVLYAGLLDEAHQQGLKAIKTTLLQIPHASNGLVAIVAAEATTERGTFSGLGDADPENVARVMLPHLIRLAETRAKARALRDAVNVSMVAVEELGPDLDERPAAAAPTSSQPAGNVVPIRQQDDEQEPTERQWGAIKALARKAGLSDAELTAFCERSIGLPFFSLTRRDASNLITALQEEEKAAAHA